MATCLKKKNRRVVCDPIFTEKLKKVVYQYKRIWYNVDIVRHTALHYENTPIQIHWNFYHQKFAIFRIKILIFFIFLLKT